MPRILELPTGEIQVWQLRFPDLRDRFDLFWRLLSPDERERATRFRRLEGREAFVLARGALRFLLSGYVGTAAEKLVFQYSENGKPYLGGSGVGFNVSHSGDRALLAFGRGFELGIDIERVRPRRAARDLAARYFMAEELARIDGDPDPEGMFFRVWVRKEALAKARGSTLFREMGAFPVPMSGTRDGWFFQGLEAEEGYAAALVADRKPREVRVRAFV